MSQPTAEADQVWYFAYGSNMDAGQMMDRRVRFSAAKKAVLKDHTLVFNRYSVAYGAGVADIISREGDSVEGVLYLVTERGLKALDVFEGVDKGLYRRTVVTVEDEKGTQYRAACYVVVDKSVVNIHPSPDYLSKLVKGAEAFGLTPSYIQKLRDRLARSRRPGGAPP